MANKKLKAGALNFAIVLALVAATLALLLLHWQGQVNQVRHRHSVQWQLRENCLSAWALLATTTPIQEFERTQYDLFQEGTDSVVVICRMWGGYMQASITACRRAALHRKNVIFGPAYTDLPVLWLTASRHALHVAGNTRITGHAILPEKGVKAAYIEGKPFQGNELIRGTISQAGRQFPEISSYRMAYLQRLASQRFLPSDSLGEWPQKNYWHPWHKATLVLQAPPDGHVPVDTLGGNIIITGISKLIIQPEQQLEDVLLVAPKIILLEQTPQLAHAAHARRMHLVATDTILLGQRTALAYPSSLTLIQKANSSACIKLCKQARVAGIVLSVAPITRRGTQVDIQLDSGSVVMGQVYSNGHLNAQGKILGNTMAHRIMLHTRAGIYENHLLDATLNADSLPKPFAGLPLENILPYHKPANANQPISYPALWLP